MKNILILASAVLLLASESANAADRPFWTEKSTYEEGSELFIVGVGSNVTSVESAREKATASAQHEIQSYLMTNRPVRLDSHMTFEETNKDGTITSFRLFTLPLKDLQAMKAFLLKNPAPYTANVQPEPVQASRGGSDLDPNPNANICVSTPIFTAEGYYVRTAVHCTKRY